MQEPLTALTPHKSLSAPGWLPWLAGGVPLAFYVATATAHGGLFEEGALIAAAQSLGVAHPPGSPLSTLVSALFAQLPIGPLAFRVSVGAGVCAAGLLAMFARALFFTLLGVGLRAEKRAALIALAAAWFVGQTPMFWMQAVRPNVYALQFLLSLIVIEALVRFELSEPTEDTRLLYFAAFVQGLCFANHHVYALWMLSAAAPTLGRVFARRGFIGLMGHVAFPILGFSASAYLPIRASQNPAINVGDPENLGNLYWFITGEQTWGPRDVAAHPAFETLSAGLGGTGPWLLLTLVVLGAVPFWFALRVRPARRFAVLWALVLAVPFLSYAWLIPPQQQVDAWGSLLPCELGLVVLATVGAALSVEHWARLRERLQAGFAVALLAASGLMYLGGHGAGLTSFVEPDAIDEAAYRALPTRSILLLSERASVFRHLGVQAEEQLRGDVVLVPLPLLQVPGAADQLGQRSPELRPLLSEYLMNKRLTLDPLQSVSAGQPTLLELSPEMSASLYGSLIADSWYQRVLSDGATATDERTAAVAQEAMLSKLSLSEQLGTLPPALGEGLRLKLGNMRFFQALLAASHGELEFARTSLVAAQEALPRDPKLTVLEQALPQKGRLAPDRVLEQRVP